jgi:hypothetical protein
LQNFILKRIYEENPFLSFVLKTMKRAVITFRNKFLYFLNIVFQSPKSGADLKTFKNEQICTSIYGCESFVSKTFFWWFLEHQNLSF